MVRDKLIPNWEAGASSKFHVDARAQEPEPSIAALPGHKQGAAFEMEQLGHEMAPTKDW